MIQFKKISKGYRRAGKGRSKGFVHATADGYNVTLTEGRGWLCYCDDTDCDHPEQVARLVDPETLAVIEGVG